MPIKGHQIGAGELDNSHIKAGAGITSDKLADGANFIKKGDFPVTKEKGYKFSFKLETKKSAIVLSNFDGDDVDENAKKALEGEYVGETK